MLDALVKKLLSQGVGITKKRLEQMSYRSKYSNYLPYGMYDYSTKIYFNTDDTIGFMWECSPLSFASLNVMNALEGLFRIAMPDKTVIQFILYADSDITHYLNSYVNLKTRNNELLKKAAKEFAIYFMNGTNGLKNLAYIPIREFRLFVAVKMPLRSPELKHLSITDMYHNIEEILRGGGNLYPYPMPPEELIRTLKRLFNNRKLELVDLSANSKKYDDNIPIAKQIIFSDTVMDIKYDHIKIGNKHFRCITPKLGPKEVDLLQTNRLFGGIDGMRSNNDQIRTPFLYCYNIIIDNAVKSQLHAKCNLILQQKGVGSFAPALMRRQDEHLWAADELEKGTKFYRIMPILWVFGEDRQIVDESIVRAKRIWESNGYEMQEDKGILSILFMSALPFGLINVGQNVANIERDFIVPASTATVMLPVQADFAGGGKPILLFAGRKGQVCALDIFDKHANNHNAYVVASTGAGKSFLVNYLALNYYSNGTMIRIIDIGDSYKKMTKMCNAKYMDFAKEHELCINPFTNVYEEQYDLPIIEAIVAEMAYSASESAVPAETEMTLIKKAVQWAYTTYTNDANIDIVHNYLSNYPQYDDDIADDMHNKDEVISMAHTLAFNIHEFTSAGRYGKYFNGKSNFDISHDEFVVLELEHIKPQKDLFKVATLQILNMITQDMYLSDRSKPRLLIIDESWQFIHDGTILQRVIEEAFRRCRRYNAGIIIISQSLLDLKQFGRVGTVIRGNSAFTFLLESADFDQAKADKLINYDEFTMNWLKTIKSDKPQYSEIFMDTPFGVGIVRLTVDDYSYYTYTSFGPEIAEMEAMIDQGMTYDEAIKEMIRKHRSE